MLIDIYVNDIANIPEKREIQEKYLRELSLHRQEKVNKLKTDGGRRLSIGAGLLLKRALQKYSIEEKNVFYSISENGKPFISEYPDIHFNLSHSHEKVMCVCAEGINVGCDVELVKPGRRHIAERFFCESEKELIRSLESFDDAADAMFFTLWTLKESFVKCTGEGLGRDLNSFTFEKTYDGSLSFLSKDKKETEKETENRPLSFLPFKLEGENRYRFVSFSDSSRIDGADMNKLDSEILSGPYIYSICYELADNIKNEDIKFEIHDVKK